MLNKRESTDHQCYRDSFICESFLDNENKTIEEIGINKSKSKIFSLFGSNQNFLTQMNLIRSNI